MSLLHRLGLLPTSLVLGALLLTACAGLPNSAAPDLVAPGSGPARADTARVSALHWTLSSADGVFLGSATAVGARHLLTNRHVVAAANGRPIVAWQGDHRLAVLHLNESRNVDLALLEIGGMPAAIASLRDSPLVPGEALAVAGAQFGEQRVGRGEALGANAGHGPGLRLARLPAAPGFSGGPVVDRQGRLVGVVMAAAAHNLAAARRLSAMGPADPPPQGVVLMIAAPAIVAEFAQLRTPY